MQLRKESLKKAMITKQKAFNKSLIDQETQGIFLDEAYAGLLEPDDWKVD